MLPGPSLPWPPPLPDRTTRSAQTCRGGWRWVGQHAAPRARVAAPPCRPQNETTTPACAAEEGVAWVAQCHQDGAVDQVQGRLMLCRLTLHRTSPPSSIGPRCADLPATSSLRDPMHGGGVTLEAGLPQETPSTPWYSALYLPADVRHTSTLMLKDAVRQQARGHPEEHPAGSESASVAINLAGSDHDYVCSVVCACRGPSSCPLWALSSPSPLRSCARSSSQHQLLVDYLST